MGYCVVRQERFDEFRARILESDRIVHLNNYIEVTYQCNLRCQQCYNPRKKDPSNEMTAAEIIHFIDLFVGSGCLWLNFSGGEPFMRRDFLDIYLYAKSKGLLVGILTNGTLITKEIARVLGDDPPSSLDLTIYGASAKTYERVTGVAGGFDLCLRGIDNLLEAGVNMRLQTCVSVLNKDDIPAIGKLAQERKVKYAYDPNIHPRIDGDQYPVTLRLAPHEVSAMRLSDESLHPRLREYLEYYFDHPCTRDRRLVKCGMLQEGFWMDPYGRLRCCAIIPEPAYDLRSGGTLEEAWHMFNDHINAQVASEDNPCVRCDIAFFCMQCPAWSDLHHKDWNKKVDYLCAIAHEDVRLLKQWGLWPEKHTTAVGNIKEVSYAEKEKALSEAGDRPD